MCLALLGAPGVRRSSKAGGSLLCRMADSGREERHSTAHRPAGPERQSPELRVVARSVPGQGSLGGDICI